MSMIKKQQFYTVGVRTFHGMFYDSRVLYTVYIAKSKIFYFFQASAFDLGLEFPICIGQFSILGL